MLHRSGRVVALVALVSGALLTVTVEGAEKTIKPANQWTGIVRETKPSNAADLIEDKAVGITSGKELQKLWKAWKFDDSVPQVDFKKQFVLVTWSKARFVHLTLKLEKGNLAAESLVGMLVVPGEFGYRIVAVSRKGIKTVNGKKLSN